MKAQYSGSPIAHPEALARALRLSVNDLKSIAGAASKKYSDFEIDKRDGTKRTVSGPDYDLKIIQKRINRILFEEVDYPEYLTGGLKGRDYVGNASLHSGAAVILTLDIKDFFPNISRNHVASIFKHFFRFAPSVVDLLSDLCTKDGAVPQGACTSTYVANLAFFESEPRLVGGLKEQGLVYSRLIDDITISSRRPVSKKRIEKIIEQVSKMLNYHGFTLKHKKTKITSASNPESLMEVTGLWLNRGHPRVKREERASIRRDVRSCVAQGAFDRYDEKYHAFHEKVSGRLSKLAQLKHSEAEPLRQMMRSVLPLYNAAATKKTKALVAGVRKTPIKTRASRAYIERFHKIMYRLNILARNQPDLATELRSKMRRFAPTQNVEEAIHG